MGRQRRSAPPPAHGGMSSLSTADPNGGGDYFASVEVVADMVQVVVFGPVSTTTTTLTRGEARDLAYRMVEASQWITEEDR
jgi:hypothetical protein